MFNEELEKEVREIVHYKFKPIVNTLSGISLGFDLIFLLKSGKDIKILQDKCYQNRTLLYLQIHNIKVEIELLNIS